MFKTIMSFFPALCADCLHRIEYSFRYVGFFKFLFDLVYYYFDSSNTEFYEFHGGGGGASDR